jgi:protein-arginine kinase activator protein McsA
VTPNTPIALLIPSRCRHCRRAATVRLQHVIQGEKISLSWQCSACQAEWPVTRKEASALRSSVPAADRHRIAPGIH